MHQIIPIRLVNMKRFFISKFFFLLSVICLTTACSSDSADKNTKDRSNNAPNARKIAPAAGDDALSQGTIAHNIPDSMSVGKKQRIEVRLIRSKDRISVVQNMRGSQKIKIADIKVGKAMGVKLIASPHEFEVLKHSSEIQAVGKREYTLWEWDVTPLKDGKHDLHLKVIVRKGSYNKDLPVLDKSVRVVTTDTKKWVTFFNDNKEWIMGSLVIPLLLFIASRLSRRRTKPAPKKKPAAKGKKPAAKKKPSGKR